MINLNEMKVTELKAMAKELGISNWWTLKKNDLITEITFAIADKEDAGEDVDVEALASADPVTESESEIKPQTEAEPDMVPMPGTEKPNWGKDHWGSEKPEPLPKPKRGELIHYKGKAQNLCAWAEELGINANTLYGRLYKLGWSIERAFAIKK